MPDTLAWWRQVPVAALEPELPQAQPCRQQYHKRRAWFGATHVHTSASYDATAFGSTATPDRAYAFARGEALPLRLWGDAADAEVPVR